MHRLHRIHTDLDTTRRRVVVQAGQTLINDLARTPGIRIRPEAGTLIIELCRNVLQI